MSGLTLDNLYSVMVFFSCGLSIYSVYSARTKESQNNGVDEGIMATDIKYIKESLDDIKSSVANLEQKVENKYAQLENDVKELLISNTELKQSYKSLHRRVDEFEKKLNNNV